jgi:hypothetical protein
LVGGYVGSKVGLVAVEKGNPIPGIEHEFFGLSVRGSTEPAIYKAMLNNPIYKKIHIPLESAVIKIYKREPVNWSQMEIK